ncbi:zinc metalloprotease HtpX [Thermoplasma sp. Kam2015]|uniref:zinc metalloprotease HtpX n=1 Tax=Thermoplasma sp. Kam2015 TaxID=2094122 RepID=UPI000D901552|nr:zinc metalloprotease HtpX [Thermoplasma sp. Kam2015]PYB68191.1 zinc metalloprotease HtpX [Thermoplasma sp. Kam2015]
MSLMSIRIKLGSLAVGVAIFAIGFGIIYGIMYYIGFNIGVLALLIILAPIFIIMDILQWLFGPYMIGAVYRTHRITPDEPEYTMLNSIVSEVAKSNKIKTPDIYIAEVDIPNAFAYGSPIAGRRIAVTRGLLRILDPEEIKAVIGHEMGHLRHRDVEMLLAVGLIPTLIFYFGYTLLFSDGRGRNAGGILLLAIVAIVASFLFRFLILAFNRMRESYADINSALTVDGGADKLQTALAKIVSATGHTGYSFRRRRKNTSSNLTEMLFFSNPDVSEAGDYRKLVEEWKTAKVSLFSDFFSDHPHPAKRIQRLERMKDRKM